MEYNSKRTTMNYKVNARRCKAARHEDCRGVVLIEMALVIPLLLLSAMWTVSFSEQVRERAVAYELAGQAAMLAGLYCVDEYAFDKSIDMAPNPLILEIQSRPSNIHGTLTSQAGVGMSCLDQIKLLFESQREFGALPYFEMAISVWRAFPATGNIRGYTRCFRYPKNTRENGLIAVADDNRCAGAQVRLITNYSRLNNNQPMFDFRNGKDIDTIVVDRNAGRPRSPIILAEQGAQGKRFRVEVDVLVRSEAKRLFPFNYTDAWIDGTASL